MTLEFLDLPVGQRKLNIGCGFDRMPGHVNIDLEEFHKPDVIADALDLAAIPDGWADEVVAKDVIEHFKRTQSAAALYEWNRTLRPGGRLFLSTTYLTGLMRRIDYEWFGSLESHQELVLNLFSTQAYPGDYHCTAFTEKLIRFYLWETGFDIETIEVADNWLFRIWAVKREDYTFSSIALSSESETEFVCELYRKILLREGEPEGVGAKVEALSSGKATRRQVIKDFLLSEEREQIMVRNAPEFELCFDRA
jgi:SAM-dependent methyltransferase